MNKFDFIRFKTFEETLKFLSMNRVNTKVIVGGTDLIIELRNEEHPKIKYVLDISHLKKLKKIQYKNGNIILGPLVTFAEILDSQLIKEKASILYQMAEVMGGPQIRNRATVGGNIVNAAPCADSVPPLIALDARITLSSAKKNKKSCSIENRQLNLSDFFVGHYKTKIKKDEILSSIIFPALNKNQKYAFIKLGRREAMSVSRMSVAVILEEKNGVIKDIRIACGSTTPVPYRVKLAEEVLLNKKWDEELIAKAGQIVSNEMIKITGIRWSTEYKKPVIKVLVIRAIKKALGVDYLK